MPVYNGEFYIREAVKSILCQTFRDFELIIVNDGSTDGTAAIIQELSHDKRIKVINNPANLGLTSTRNKGIAACSGAYLAMLDSDDIALPERLEKQVKFLDSNPDFGLVGSYVDLIDSNGVYLETQKYDAAPEFIPGILLFQNYFAQSAVMVRKTALPPVAYRSEYPLAEDYDLWTRISVKHKVANLKEVLSKYRIHQRNISKTKAEALAANLKGIAAEQLTQLEIFPSPDELELHTRIGQLDIPSCKEFIKAAEQWLLRILLANEKTKYYPSAAFRIVVAHKWYETCKVSGQGIWAYRQILCSPLSSAAQFCKLMRSKLKGSSIFSFD